MTNSISPQALLHSIADVERDTGLSKDTLRVWERRYGFPTPVRDALGERQYDDHQLQRLRQIRRLLDAGHRPGRVVPLPPEALRALDTQTGAPRIQPVPRPAAAALPQAAGAPTLEPPLVEWMRWLHAQDAQALRQSMVQTLLERGLARLVTECVVPMNVWVGQSWLEGRLAVFEEHLYTEIVQGVLRQAMGQVASGRPAMPPRVLMTTVPGEPHALGLLMAECFLVLEGCQIVPLGTQTPLPDIVRAAEASGADIVALSFTATQNPRDVRQALAQLRQRLAAPVEIWAGGQCQALYRAPRGETASPHWPMARLEDIAAGVARWRLQASARQANPGGA
ncbi:MAG: MerR family transcriptional regulator [Hydrogenophaga sp.]|nr:MerR family transcriptional regulator [Hydrogenophaga sp.]